jgi:hypothetical protein
MSKIDFKKNSTFLQDPRSDFESSTSSWPNHFLTITLKKYAKQIKIKNRFKFEEQTCKKKINI